MTAERAAEVLAEHVSQVGPISGAWHCHCGAVSSNGAVGTGDLTTRAGRTSEFIDHLAAAIAPLLAEAWDEGLGFGQLHWTTNYAGVYQNGIPLRPAPNPYAAER